MACGKGDSMKVGGVSLILIHIFSFNVFFPRGFGEGGGAKPSLLACRFFFFFIPIFFDGKVRYCCCEVQQRTSNSVCIILFSVCRLLCLCMRVLITVFYFYCLIFWYLGRLLLLLYCMKE